MRKRPPSCCPGGGRGGTHSKCGGPHHRRQRRRHPRQRQRRKGTQRSHRSRTALRHRDLPGQPGRPLLRYRKAWNCNRTRSHALGRAPLVVGRDGQRITQGTLQLRIKRALKRAGPDAQPVLDAMVHGLRHTYATELAAADVSVYTLMQLLGHESMTTSHRDPTTAGTETRSAAAQSTLRAHTSPRRPTPRVATGVQF